MCSDDSAVFSITFAFGITLLSSLHLIGHKTFSLVGTMSTLHSFINDLLETHQIASSRVIIITDNAKLTLENRLKVSASFLSPDEASDRRPCRWSSTPVLRPGHSTSSLIKNVVSGQSKKSGSQNATWDDFKRPSAINMLPSVGSSTMTTTSKKSRSSSRLSPPNRRASLQKSTSFTAPKLPERCFSPQHGGKLHLSRSTSLSVCPPITERSSKGKSSKSSKSTKQQKIPRNAIGSMASSKSNKQQTIRNALGSMAPSSKKASKRLSPKRPSRKSLQLSSSKSDAQPLSRDLLPPTLRGLKISTTDKGVQRNWAEEAIKGLNYSPTLLS
jgi:hypothetical protein